MSLRVALDLAQNQVIITDVLHPTMLTAHVRTHGHPMQGITSLNHSHTLIALLQPTHPLDLVEVERFQGLTSAFQFGGQPLLASRLPAELFMPMHQQRLLIEQGPSIDPVGGHWLGGQWRCLRRHFPTELPRTHVVKAQQLHLQRRCLLGKLCHQMGHRKGRALRDCPPPCADSRSRRTRQRRPGHWQCPSRRVRCLCRFVLRLRDPHGLHLLLQLRQGLTHLLTRLLLREQDFVGLLQCRYRLPCGP